MRTLRKFGGQIRAVPLRQSAQWGMSVILGAYLSIHLVAPVGQIG
jgi:hypothetical protein